MTREQIQEALAAIDGWIPAKNWSVVRTETHCVYQRGNELRTTRELPDYLGDRNALHAVFNKLGDAQKVDCVDHLYGLCRMLHEDKDVAMAMAGCHEWALSIIEGARSRV